MGPFHSADADLAPEKCTASQWIIDGMRASLPVGCPLPFTVTSAKFIKETMVQAHVQLFDDLVGTLQVSRMPCGGYSCWCISWVLLPGGAVNWNGTAWERTALLRQREQEEDC